MILLVSTCSEKLSEEEFVKPISEIIKEKHEIIHYSEIKDLNKYSKIIICGTALMDNAYLENIDKFSWLKDTKTPVLGICSGMQSIALSFGATLIISKEIGMKQIKIIKQNKLFSEDFEAYCLHGNGLENLNKFDILAESDASVQAIKHKSKDIYGIMFHPEVRNEAIIEGFVNK